MADLTAQPITTFILLRSHEPACPPSITDAGSQAGQAFNQVLRYIAGCPGFQSQLFGWPAETTSEDIDVNEWMASIMPGSMGVFINWDDDRAANNFLSPASMAQAFQGLTAFFEVPKTAAAAAIRSLNEPAAFNIAWQRGDAAKMLNRTKLPLQISISEECGKLSEESQCDNDHEDANGAVGVITASAGKGDETFVHIRHVLPGAPTTAERQHNTSLSLNLMRTRYCSRLKEDLYDMIRARRVD